MTVRSIRVAVLLALGALLLGACQSANPSPSVPGSPGLASPTGPASALSGGTDLVVAGRVKTACVAPPEGCEYWVSMLPPGGAPIRAEFGWNPPKKNLVPGDGLPASLPFGRYTFVFEVALVSDVASYVDIPGGTPGIAPPVPEAACTTIVEVTDQKRVKVQATFDGFDCTIKLTPPK